MTKLSFTQLDMSIRVTEHQRIHRSQWVQIKKYLLESVDTGAFIGVIECKSQDAISHWALEHPSESLDADHKWSLLWWPHLQGD